MAETHSDEPFAQQKGTALPRQLDCVQLPRDSVEPNEQWEDPRSNITIKTGTQNESQAFLCSGSLEETPNSICYYIAAPW